MTDEKLEELIKELKALREFYDMDDEYPDPSDTDNFLWKVFRALDAWEKATGKKKYKKDTATEPAAQDLEYRIFTCDDLSTLDFMTWLANCFSEYEENDRPALKVVLAPSRMLELTRRDIIDRTSKTLWGAKLLEDRGLSKNAVKLYRRKLTPEERQDERDHEDDEFQNAEDWIRRD